MRPRPPRSTLFPYTTLFRSILAERPAKDKVYRLPDGRKACEWGAEAACVRVYCVEALPAFSVPRGSRSEEHTSELQSRQYIVCRLLLEKKKQSRHYSAGNAL